jgi:hypothetical protein
MILAQEKTLGKMLKGQFAQIARFVADSSREGKRLDEVERGLLSRLLELGRKLLEGFIEQAGAGDEGPTLSRQGKTLRRSQRPHRKPYRSIFGVVRISRYVYFTREKQKVEAVPLDERLGVPAGEQSYVLEDWIARLVVQMPYGEAVNTLYQWFGLDTSVRAAEKIVRQLGEYVEPYRATRPAPPAASEAEVVVVTVDGKGVPVRRPLEQRLEEEAGIPRHKRSCRTGYAKASKRLHRGDKRVRKQMACVAAVYSIDRWPRRPADVLDEVRRQASDAERPRPRNKRLWAEMTQVLDGRVSRGAGRLFVQLAGEVGARNPGRTRPPVCLMDGDRSLWELKKGYLSQAVGILDLYHVLEKLWKAAYSFHPESSAEAEAFVHRYLQMLLEGKVGYVIGVFRRLLKRHKLRGGKRKGLQRAIDYFEANRDAMRYDQYLAAGYPIGSGVAEGACRHVVKDRMERTGMRWEIEGAQPMLDLRTTYLNDEWSAFMEYRIQTEQAALAAQAA